MATFATRTPAKTAPPRRRELEPASRTPAEVQVPREEIAKRAFEKFAGRGFVHGVQEQALNLRTHGAKVRIVRKRDHVAVAKRLVQDEWLAGELLERFGPAEAAAQ